MSPSSDEKMSSREEVLGKGLEELFQKHGLLPEDQALVRQILKEWDKDPADKTSMAKIRGHPRASSIILVLGKLIEEYCNKMKAEKRLF